MFELSPQAACENAETAVEGYPTTKLGIIELIIKKEPDANFVARWRASGAQVLQAGRRGTVTVSTDGEDLKVGTFIER